MLETSPDEYFQNLNTRNEKYIQFRNKFTECTKSNNDEEDIPSIEAEEEERGATASTGVAGNFGFFF